jgi:hypothetical protein
MPGMRCVADGSSRHSGRKCVHAQMAQPAVLEACAMQGRKQAHIYYSRPASAAAVSVRAPTANGSAYVRTRQPRTAAPQGFIQASESARCCRRWQISQNPGLSVGTVAQQAAASSTSASGAASGKVGRAPRSTRSITVLRGRPGGDGGEGRGRGQGRPGVGDEQRGLDGRVAGSVRGSQIRRSWGRHTHVRMCALRLQCVSMVWFSPSMVSMDWAVSLATHACNVLAPPWHPLPLLLAP